MIFDNDLSAVQVNNLDLALGIKVIDRTELILQIFARRARSAEAQIQVELAQLEYLVSRIPVSRRQQRFQGGIGMRGPGESPLQLRNAPMRRRIKELKEKLERIQQRRRRTRSAAALAAGLPGRLHERRQVHAAERVRRRQRLRGRPAVRHAGHEDAAGAAWRRSDDVC